SWGWQIEVFFEEGVATTSMIAGPGHNWIMQRLQELMGIDESEGRNDTPVSPSLEVLTNPAKGMVIFRSQLPPDAHNAEIRIYTVTGRLIKTLPCSGNEIHWDCKDSSGNRVPSGTYIALLENDGHIVAKNRVILF
ncbi:FlgD immunoglobulin-like domain containing protein, partial [Hydrogenimonas sp.]